MKKYWLLILIGFIVTFSHDYVTTIILRQHAKTAAFLSGGFQLKKMNFFEKFIVRKASKATNCVFSIDYKKPHFSPNFALSSPK